MAIKDLALSVAIKLKDELSKGLGRAGSKVRDFGRATSKANRSTSPFSQALGKLSKKAKEVRSSFGLAKAAAVGFASYMTGRVVGALTGASDAWSQLSAQIKLVTKSEQESIAVREQLLELSNRTRTSLDANVQLYASLARSTENLGLSQSDLLGITETISQAMKVSGASAAESAGSLRQLAQALASGVLRGDEFNSMNEQAPRLMQALSDQLGVTRGDLRAMAEEGQLTADKLIAAFQGQGEKIGNEFAVLPKTFSGVFQSIKNDILAFVGKTDQASGASARMIESISNGWEKLKGVISDNSNAIVDAVQGVGAALVVFGAAARVGFNVVTIAARTLTASIFSLIWGFEKLLATVTFGDTSRAFARDAQAMADTINALGADIGGDFRDIADAISPAEDAAKKTGDAAEKAGKQVKGLADEASKGVKAKVDVEVDRITMQAELAHLQQYMAQHPVKVKVQADTSGISGSALQDEVLKRGDL